MPSDWASIAKRSITATTPAQEPLKKPEVKLIPAPQKPTINAAGPAIPPTLLKIGDLDIPIEKYLKEIKLPLLIPLDTEFWKQQHNERRRRREIRKNGGTHSDLGGYPSTDQKPVTSEDSINDIATDLQQLEIKPKPKPTSWAALFESKASSAVGASSPPNTGALGPAGAPSGDRNGSGLSNNRNGDTTTHGITSKLKQFTTLEDALENWVVEFDAPPVQPRGLVNTGNMCFMNAVLQALLYCAPFYNMLWSIKESVAFSFKTTTPLLEALIQYVHEFKQDNVPLSQLLSSLDEPFVPENVYEALRKKNVFQTLRGQQEDAQEFMSYLVDGIHEEMISILQMHQMNKEKATSVVIAVNGTGTNGKTLTSPTAIEIDKSDEWLEVGPNNKAGYVRDSVSFTTPITQIFGGTQRSTLSIPSSAVGNIALQAGMSKPPQSSNKEPFQWISLDISPDDVGSIEDALDEYVAPETIEGYLNLKGEMVNATKQVLLETMPPVLVLHLKRFVFCPNEGVQKVPKFIEYPSTLSLRPKWFVRSASSAKYRNTTYKLTSVIYHHGSYASGGHYTCDLLRSSNEWLRFDDCEIDSLSSVQDVLEEKDDRTAYILFYTISH